MKTAIFLLFALLCSSVIASHNQRPGRRLQQGEADSPSAGSLFNSHWERNFTTFFPRDFVKRSDGLEVHTQNSNLLVELKRVPQPPRPLSDADGIRALLSDGMIAASLLVAGLGDPLLRLRRVMCRAASHRPLTVGVLGGSLATGQECLAGARRNVPHLPHLEDRNNPDPVSETCAWPGQLRRWLAAVFPGQAHRVVNLAHGSTSSSSAVGVLRSHDFEFDLVVVDFSINDDMIMRSSIDVSAYAAAERALAEQTEAIVRTALGLPSAPALLYLETFQQDGDNSARMLYDASPMFDHVSAGDVQARVCRYYGVPMVSYRAAVYDAYQQNHALYHSVRSYSSHPYWWAHVLIARIVEAALVRVAPPLHDGDDGSGDGAAGAAACDDARAGDAALPPMLYDMGEEASAAGECDGNYTSRFDATEPEAVVEVSRSACVEPCRWTLTEDRPRRPGWIVSLDAPLGTTLPDGGATNAITFAIRVGSTGTVRIGYLRSYSREWGVVRATLTPTDEGTAGGAAIPPIYINSLNEAFHFSVEVFETLPNAKPGRYQLTLLLVSGQKFKLISIGAC
jgi:hypothetical protein